MFNPCKSVLKNSNKNLFSFAVCQLIAKYFDYMQLSLDDLHLDEKQNLIILAEKDYAMKNDTDALNKYLKYLENHSDDTGEINKQIFNIAIEANLFDTAKKHYQAWQKIIQK